MATLPPAPTGAKKLSFAKVAASASKEQRSGPNARPFAPVLERRDQNLVPAMTSSPAGLTTTSDASQKPMRPMESGAAYTAQKVAGSQPRAEETDNEGKVVEGLKDLKLEMKMPSLVVNGSGSTTTERSSKAGNSQTPSDDNSQRADSNSELGTKPPSLDGKSITSGTTFALDEKESLRPDDSASVQAAAEDDDAFSIRGSLIAGSRMGSEVAGRIHRIQLGDMPPRTITTLVTVQSQGLATPQSGASEKQPATDPKLPLEMASTGPDDLTSNGLYSQNPDEKLLEAMQSPKDRFFLLKLEHQVIEFVQGSEEPFMDLPPSNSFCRMLTHKLADYYHMTHSFEPVPGAVRIYRTPFCRIPPALSTIVVSTPSSNSPAPVLLPRKIMRRGEDGEAGLASNNPSKPTSEAGSDSKEKGNVAKEKLTREEREEAYNRARERIFRANAEKTETSTPDGDDSNGVSRASSVSAKDKSNATNKRKPAKGKRDDSEGFDTRSSYMVINGVQQPTWAATSQQYYHVGNPAAHNGQFSQPYQGAWQPPYGPNPSYPQPMPQNVGFGPQYNNMPSYPSQPPAQPMPQPPMQQPPQQQCFPPPAPPLSVSYSAPVPNVPQPGWQAQQNFSQSQYPVGRAPNAQPPAGGIPYAYGQLPVNTNPMDPKTQHPIPGSYSRQPFNPKTQSFVPSGNGMVPIQPPVSYGNTTPHHGSPQFSNPLPNYNSYQSPITQSGGYVGNGSGYGMARQGSNNSIPPYHLVQQVHQSPMGLSHVPPHVPPQKHMLPNPPPHIPSKPVVAPGHGQQQTFSNLPNYGNPATLPQKPPPT